VGDYTRNGKTLEYFVIFRHTVFPDLRLTSSEQAFFPVGDGIFDNTPALHHSSSPYLEHVTAEPFLPET
jgi:hypothetical protein